MTPTLIVIALLVVGVGIVVWVTRRNGPAPTRRQEGDTAWNDPVTPGEPARPQPPRPDEPAAVSPPAQDPRP